MSVQLPSSIVEDIVKAEIARNLGSTAEIVRGIVDNATKGECACDKHRHSYGKKPTAFSCQFDRKIEEVCKETIAKWVTDNRDKFEAALLVEMSKPGRLKALVGAFANGIRAGKWGVDVKLVVGKDES